MRWLRVPVVLLTALLLFSPPALGLRPLPDLDGASGSGAPTAGDSGLRPRRLLLLLRQGRQDPASAPAPAPWLLRGPVSDRGSPPPGPRRGALRPPGQPSERPKRHPPPPPADQPPLSIDLTFHLLRQMMEISRAQSQQAQARLNRLLLDSVGK